MLYKRIAVIIVIFTGLASCTLLKTSCLRKTVADRTNVDSLLVIYNDSVDNILWNADKVRIYDMADFTVSHDSVDYRDSLFNYKIKKDIGLLRKEEKAILSFIISDKNWYKKNYAPMRQPFHPNIALEFTTEKCKVFMFISFGSEEVAISDRVGNFKFYQMYDQRLMARWAYLIFPEEEYFKELIKS